MKKDVVAVVLAGGEGKRFWPIQKSKSQLSFLAKSLLVHNLERLTLTGITDVIVVVAPQDEKTVSKLSIPKLTIRTVVQSKSNGMAGAMLAAEPLLKDKSCFVMNAEDLVTESLFTDLSKVIGGEKIVMVGKKFPHYFPGGYLILDNNSVVGIVEKPGAGNEPSNLVNLVFHYFPDSAAFFKRIDAMHSEKDDQYEKALDELLKQHGAALVVYDGLWKPMKYPWHVLETMEALLGTVGEFRGKNVDIRSHVVIEGPVYIADNVKIMENTKIVGPCYIGPDTIIGNNTIIRHSHIGAGCVTGFNTDITRSYVGNHCWFHSNYIGDSVLVENVSMGSGAVLANLRLDEGEIYSVVKGERVGTKRDKLGAVIGKGVRIGVNASIMPGIKVGADSMIGAGVILDRDLPVQSYCVGKAGYTVSKNTKSIAYGIRETFRKNI